MNNPIEKNQFLKLPIESYNAEGAGVGRYNNVVIFVPNAIVGETVTAQIIKVSKHYAVAKLLEVQNKSPNRATPPCPVFDRCGGCSLQHMDQKEQIFFKSRRIDESFARIGHIRLPQEPIVHSMENPIRYRNKASFPVTQCNERPQIGLYAKRSHRVVEVDDCLLQDFGHAEIIRTVRNWMEKNSVSSYDEQTHRGLLRHVVTRRSQKGAYLVCLVSTAPLPHTDRLIKSLLGAVPSIDGIVLNLNRRQDNVILGEEERLLYGEQRITEELMGLQFSVSIRSFIQVNPIQTEVLYQLALDYARLRGDETVVDAYCGIGTMTLLFAKHARFVYGVECVQAAIDDARINAALNGIDNVEFRCDFAEKALPEMLRKGERIDVLLLDPPRKGCEEAVLRSAIEAGIPRIVYVSCDPATQARDIAILREAGYSLMRIEGVDMFPQTSHVETCVLLSHKNPQTSPPSL